jgi:hypothetical protein
MTGRKEGATRNAELSGWHHLGHLGGDHAHRRALGGLDPGLALDDQFLREVAQLVGREGLLDILAGALLEGLDGGLDAAITRNDDHIHIRPQVLHALHHIHAVHVWHLEIREDEVVVAALHQAQGLGTVLHRVHTEALQHEDPAEGIQHHGFVVHGEDAGLGIGHLHPLEALGLVGEVQPDRGFQDGLAGLPFRVLAHPAEGRPHQEVDADEGHEHDDDQNGGHGDLLGECWKIQGVGFSICRNR